MACREEGGHLFSFLLMPWMWCPDSVSMCFDKFTQSSCADHLRLSPDTTTRCSRCTLAPSRNCSLVLSALTLTTMISRSPSLRAVSQKHVELRS